MTGEPNRELIYTSGAYPDNYVRTFTSFSGADMVVTINDVVFGELQAITYAVHREVAPIYTMGSSDPRGFARNKRGISGTLVFTVFDRDALIAAIKSSRLNIPAARFGYTATANLPTENNPYAADWQTVTDWANRYKPENKLVSITDLFTQLSPKTLAYADQIPPFDVTITMANEYADHAAQLAIRGVQIMNEGSGMTIDDVVMAKACTFIARRVDPLLPVGDQEFLKAASQNLILQR